tara:strand:+ start:313 stop:633 length:321 start_codon:yes stop_codon:yes gene_type:complete
VNKNVYDIIFQHEKEERQQKGSSSSPKGGFENGRRKRRNEDDDDCTKTTQQQQKSDDSDCDVPRKDREGARRKERETPKANVRGRGAVEGVWYVQLSREGFLSFER